MYHQTITIKNNIMKKVKLAVAVINGKRYLFNEGSEVSEKWLNGMIEHLPDAVVDFDEVKPEDVARKTVKDFLTY